jgi:hypothetical protein
MVDTEAVVCFDGPRHVSLVCWCVGISRRSSSIPVYRCSPSSNQEWPSDGSDVDEFGDFRWCIVTFNRRRT